MKLCEKCQQKFDENKGLLSIIEMCFVCKDASLRSIYEEAGVLPNRICPMCKTELNKQNVNRRSDESIRLDSVGNAWCKLCTEKHDSIDWDEFYEKGVH